MRFPYNGSDIVGGDGGGGGGKDGGEKRSYEVGVGIGILGSRFQVLPMARRQFLPQRWPQGGPLYSANPPEFGKSPHGGETHLRRRF